MTGVIPTTPPPLRQPIERAAYLAALDRAAGKLPWADPDALARLRADVDGKALAAVNQLGGCTQVAIEITTFALLQSATLALDKSAARANLAARAEKYHAAAAALGSVLELNQDPAISIPDHSTRALTELQQFLLETAHRWEEMPGKAGISQKPSAAIITLRQLRDRLFLGRTAPHEPLRLLAETALGETISADTVKTAFRKPRNGGD